jgi:hypothetical protein
MSCQACKNTQRMQDGSYFFRWKNANIELRGCETHIKEVMDVLAREIQRPRAEPS